jgi:hypothetical protein
MGRKEGYHRRPNRKISGLTGELLTAVALLRHGYTVSWPLADVDGYDLISDDGRGELRRVQVKSCETQEENGSYRVLFAKGCRKKVIYTKADCDYIVAVLFYSDIPSFYVVPIERVTATHYSFWPRDSRPNAKSRSCLLEPYRDKWSLL